MEPTSVSSGVLKSVLSYDQSTLNLVSFFKDVGTNVGVLFGLLAEVTPSWFVLSTVDMACGDGKNGKAESVDDVRVHLPWCQFNGFSLSGAILMQLYHAFYYNHKTHFLCFRT
jgi:hypothetical protein